MDEIKKLYDLLVREGKYTKSFEEFQTQWSDDEYKKKVYNVVNRDGFYTKDEGSFMQKYGMVSQPAEQVAETIVEEPVKKKEPMFMQPQPEAKKEGTVWYSEPTSLVSQEADQVPTEEQLKQAEKQFRLPTEEEYAAEQQKAIQAGTVAPTQIAGKETVMPTIETKNLPQEDIEEDYFKGSFGNVLRGFDKVVPLGIGDFIDDMARSVAAGYRQGTAAEDADRLLFKGTKATPEQIQKFIDSQKAMQQIGPSSEMQDYQRVYENEGKGFWGVVKGIVSNPTVLPELITSSLTAMATNTDALTAGAAAIGTGAGIGAAAGAPAGGVGAIPGAISGATTSIPYAFGLASSVIEAGSTFGELLQEELEGQEFTKENVKKILEDPNKLNKIRNKAIARGLIIGTVDAFTGKLASGVGAKVIQKGVAKSTTGAITRGTLAKATAAGAGVEALGGAGGETLARGAIGQEMDISEISLEGLAELPGGIRSTIQARLAKPTFRVNGERVKADQVDELINTMTPDELAKTNIEIKNDFEGRKNKIQDKIITGQIKKEVQQANPNIDDADINQLVELEKELRSFENNKTQSGKDRAADIRSQIKTIQQNAIQKQAAGQVPVQPTTGVGEKVEEGKPTTEPEVTPTEGVEETVTAEVKEEVKPTALANVESTTKALEVSLKEGGKVDEEGFQFRNEESVSQIANTFTQDMQDEYQRVVIENEEKTPEQFVSEAYHKAKQDNSNPELIKAVEQSLSNEIEVERLERELAKPEVTEGVTPSVGISISNDTEIENLRNTARSKAQEAKTNEEKQSAETKVKVLDIAQKAIKTLKSVLPDFDIVIHDNEDSFNTAMQDVNGVAGSRGNFAYVKGADGKMTGRIDINLSKANARTVAHEVAHGILTKSFGENTKLFGDFRNRLSRVLKSDVNKELNDFANRYVDPKTGQLLDVNHEEFLAELTGMLERQQASISVSTMQKIAALINEFVSTITGGKFTPFKDTKDTKDIVDFFNTISGAIREGNEIEILNSQEPYSSGVSISVKDPNKFIGKKYESKAQIGDYEFPKNIEILKTADLPVKNLTDLVRQYEGRVVIITSDATGYGVDKNGDPIFGGFGFSANAKNVGDGIGFASVSIGTVKGTYTAAEKAYGSGKVLVLVMIQPPHTTINNSYGAKYIIRGLKDIASKSKEELAKTKEAIKEFIRNSTAIQNELKKANKASEKKINSFIDSINENTDLDKAVEEFILDTTFAIRKELGKGIILENKDIRTNKSTNYSKIALNNAGYNIYDFLKEYGDNTFLTDELILDNKGGYVVGGFELDILPTEQREKLIAEIQSKGIVHPLFNAKLPGTNHFRLDGIYDVQENFSEYVRPETFISLEEKERDKLVRKYYKEDKYYKAEARTIPLKKRTYTELIAEAKTEFKEKYLKKLGALVEKTPYIPTKVAKGQGFVPKPGAAEKMAKAEYKSKAQLPEPTAAPKYVRDISVLITPATVRGFDTRTERIKDMSIKYDELVKEYATDKSEEKRIQIKELEDQILNDAKQEIIDEVNKIPGLAVKFEQPRMGLWKGAFEPSFNMTFSVTPQADTKKISDLLVNFGEKYSQDAFILETQSEQHNDFVNGKIRMPLNEEDSNGLANYPQIIYTFADPISDEKISELSTSLQSNGIDAFSVNNNELKISVLKFLSKEQEQTLSKDEQYAEKLRDFQSKSTAAAASVGDVLGSNANASLDIRIKKSRYEGAINEESAEPTRQYDRGDILKPFQQGTTEVEALSKEFAALRNKQIEGKKLTTQEQARFDELKKTVQPVVQKTFEANKKIYEQAKREVENIAEESIKDFAATISPFPIKRPERASVKTLNWYSGITENLGDGARVNIVVTDEADADAVFDKINEDNPADDPSLRRINETTDLGYPKRLIEVITPSGVRAEMQVITDKAYLAKDGVKGFTGSKEQVSDAKKELAKIRKRLGWSIPDGLGHYFYEVQRDTNVDQELRDEAKRLSELYYDAFTNEDSKLEESPFMDDVNKFRENVDKADKTNWDEGNTAKAPETLVQYKSKAQQPGKDINNVIKRGRASGVSERAIRTVLKKQGFTDAEIDAAMGAEMGAAKKVTVSEEMLPGFDRMMEQVDGIVTRSRERGANEEKVMENVMRYVEGSKAYQNASDVQKNQIIRDIEKRFGIKQKAAPKVDRVLDIKDTNKVTMSEKEALKKQIKDLARGAKNAKEAIRMASDFLSRSVKQLAESGKITVNQAANVIRKFSQVNVLSSESVERFVNYMTKVFADADYANKLSVALDARKSISKLSKNKDKDANLRALGEKFKEIDPSMVENIDEYNEIASLIKESIKGSTFRGAKLMPAQMVNIQNAMEYVSKTMEAQKKKMAEIRAAEIQEMMGVDVSDLSYEQMLQMLESKEPVTKYNEGIIRDTVNKMFDIYSSIIDKMIRDGIDPMTGDSVDMSPADKNLLKRFMAMDTNKLTVKEAISAVDALNNFIVNKSTAKMETVVRQYTGDTNANKLADSGVRSKPLQMYWIKGVGRFFGEQFRTLPSLIENMFKGVMAASKIRDASGITDIINGKAEAETKTNRIVEEYIDKFYKQKANGEDFNTEANVVERGMIAFMSRSVTGTDEQIQQDFNRRKKLIEESIDALSKGSEKEQAKAELYKAAYEKILKDSNSVDEVRRNADKTNIDAVDFWVRNWDSVFNQLADVSENVYNKILDRDINYSPDRFTRLEKAQEKIELSSDQSAFHGNTNTLYKKEAGVLMRAERPESLPKDDRGKKPQMYIDLSFDKNNANSMYDAMVDINTAGPIRQVEAFINSEGFDRMIPEVKDAKLLKDRIQLYIRNIRNKNAFDNDEFAAMMKRLNTLSSIGVGQALGGVLQPIKQTIPVAMNTLINAKGFDIGSIFNQSKMAFIDNSGYSIANRGVESQTQLNSINKLMDLAAKSRGEKALKFIEEANKLWLKIFLVKFDVFVARASWMSYYEQSLKKQGIDPKGIDYSTHKLNKEAANYAQTMVDRQQNTSDADLQGKLFTNKASINQLFVKTLLPFANFRMNQYMRLANDVTVLTSKTASSEDRKIAAWSLGGYGVESAMFSMISAGSAYLLYMLTQSLMGSDEDDEEEEKRVNSIIKGQITGRVTDLLSPIPVLDVPITAGVNMGLDKVQDAMDIAQEDKLSIYGDTKTEFLKSTGTLGISAERALQLYDLSKLAFTGEYTDSYGNEKKLSDESMDFLKGMTGLALLTNIGLAPSEANTIVKNAVRIAKSTGKTEKTIEREQETEIKVNKDRSILNQLLQEETDKETIKAIEKKISDLDLSAEERKEKNKLKKEEEESLLGEYVSKEQMKRYDPEMYEKKFGEGSKYYDKYNQENEVNKKMNELKRKIEDEEREYTKPRRKKRKTTFGGGTFGGSFGRGGF